MLIEIIIATTIISLASFVGIIFLKDSIKKYLHYLVSFAAATLLSVAFFDLLPESLESLELAGVDLHEGVLIILAGVLLFFLIERFIHWHHCDTCGDHDHDGHDHTHDSHHHSPMKNPAAILVLAGDFIHNFIDGLVVAGAFLLDVRTGIVTSLSIFAHEIPQEVGDFTVLLHSGYSKSKALLYNFYSALSSVIGGIVGYFAFKQIFTIIPYVIAIAAGGFIYIALTHIVPALHSHKGGKKVVFVESVIFFVTLALFYVLLSGHSH